MCSNSSSLESTCHENSLFDMISFKTLSEKWDLLVNRSSKPGYSLKHTQPHAQALAHCAHTRTPKSRGKFFPALRKY